MILRKGGRRVAKQGENHPKVLQMVWASNLVHMGL